MPDTVTITARTRSLGYASNSTPTRNEFGGSIVRSPSAPSIVGSLKDVEAASTRDCRIYSGGVWWRSALFVGGRRVEGIDPHQHDVGALLDELRREGRIEVRFVDPS